MAATKLFDQPMPLRCFYVGSLFRHEEPQAGRKREFTQAGVELIGADTPGADAEVVALAVATLEALELKGFQVNLGQMAFFRALTTSSPPEALAAIREAIDHKNRARLAEALDRGGCGRQAARPAAPPARSDRRAGGPGRSPDSERWPGPAARQWMRPSSAWQRSTPRCKAYGVAGRVILDLGEVRGMDYYTGITFRGVAPGLGWPIVSGGRYDDLIARFGRPLAAVGFGLGIERALLVQSRQGVPPPALAPHLLVGGCDPAGLPGAGEMPAPPGLPGGGRRPEGRGPAELAEQARQRGIQRTLRCAARGLAAGRGRRRSACLSEDALLQRGRGMVS